MRAVALALLLSSAAAAASLPKPDPLAAVERFFEAGKYDDVVLALEGGGINRFARRRRARAYEILGVSYEIQGRLDRALAVYQLAEALYPEDLIILNRLARLLHLVDLDTRARPVYERILKIHPNNAEANLGLAEVLRGQGMLEGSSEHYETALKELEKDPAAWRDYAEVLAEKQDFAGATKAIQRSLDLRFDVDSLLDLALFERRQGLREPSMRTLKNAVAGSPQRTDLRLRLALWLIEDGDLDRASEACASVLREIPDHPLARWIHARILVARGRGEEAKRDLETAIASERANPFIAASSRSMLALIDGKEPRR